MVLWEGLPSHPSVCFMLYSTVLYCTVYCKVLQDSPAGIHSAVAASLPTVGVLTGRTSATLTAAGALITVSDYTDPAFWEYVNSRPVAKLQSA